MKFRFPVLLAAFLCGCSGVTSLGSHSPQTSDKVVVLKPFDVEEPTSPDFLKHTLSVYKLSSLNTETDGRYLEHYRFLWIRSFHPAILIDIKVTAPDEARFEASYWKGTGDTGKWISKRSSTIKRSSSLE
jgi:hypothetical protein